MWKIFQRLSSADSAREEGSMVYSLEFTDKPMYLVSQKGVSSTDLASKPTSINQVNGKLSSDSGQG